MATIDEKEYRQKLEKMGELNREYEKRFGDVINTFKFHGDVDGCIEALETALRTNKPDVDEENVLY